MQHHEGSHSKRQKASPFLPTIDVIIPCHNCSKTLQESIDSSLNQSYSGEINVIVYDDGSSDNTREVMNNCKLLLEESLLKGSINERSSTAKTYKGKRFITIANSISEENTLPSSDSSLPLPITSFVSRGAGYARNRCVLSGQGQVLVFLDSDDVMMSDRVEKQVEALRDYSYVGVQGWDNHHYHCQQQQQYFRERSNLTFDEVDDEDPIHRLIVGCTFYRDPIGSTFHYTSWANSLTADRIYFEQFRELTLIQPTWCITRKRFISLGGYLQPKEEEKMVSFYDNNNNISIDSNNYNNNNNNSEEKNTVGRGLEFGCACPKHPTTLKLWYEEETLQEMKLCEDLRFFHAHLSTPIPTTTSLSPSTSSSSCEETLPPPSPPFFLPPLLHLVNSQSPLQMYRHAPNQSQSSNTSHKQLLRLRLQAFEERILRSNEGLWGKGFVIWGAGRDGKDFVKNLSEDLREKVLFMVDVDEKKIDFGYYHNPIMKIKIRVLPFQVLQPNYTATIEDKNEGRGTGSNVKGVSKKSKKDTPEIDERNIDYRKLPVVVCVAMYRTDGKLEENVNSIGRKEGVDLWHFF